MTTVGEWGAAFAGGVVGFLLWRYILRPLDALVVRGLKRLIRRWQP